MSHTRALQLGTHGRLVPQDVLAAAAEEPGERPGALGQLVRPRARRSLLDQAAVLDQQPRAPLQIGLRSRRSRPCARVLRGVGGTAQEEDKEETTDGHR